MENKPNAIGSLFENAGAYLETRLDLLKLQAVSKSTDVISSIASRIVIVILMFFGISILNIGISIWIGALVGELWWGFLIVGGFYLLLAVLFIVFKGKWIKGPLNDMLIKKMLN